jgi:hypothetical protein
VILDGIAIEWASGMQEPKELKEKVMKLYQKHITAPVEAHGLEDGIQKEYHRQRDYLERTVLGPTPALCSFFYPGTM